jgi:hypothetical protein
METRVFMRFSVDNLGKKYLTMNDSKQTTKPSSWGVITVIIIIVLAVFSWLYVSSEQEKEVIVIPPPLAKVLEVEPEPIIEPEVVIPEPEPVVKIIEEPAAPLLPSLDDSDAWVQEKLPNFTWRKELLKLVINQDMIRRFVVFTDNFAQGNVAYEHSPLVKPSTTFSAKEIKNGSTSQWQWDEKATHRFSLYVDLLRSLDSETMVAWYFEMKPLIDQAYEELGYPDDDFTDVLHEAITKVLDMEIPKETLTLERPSVMYRYKNNEIESLDDSKKLLLRLGKENLLVIKSVLLEINERLARERS